MIYINVKSLDMCYIGLHIRSCSSQARAASGFVYLLSRSAHLITSGLNLEPWLTLSLNLGLLCFYSSWRTSFFLKGWSHGFGSYRLLEGLSDSDFHLLRSLHSIDVVVSLWSLVPSIPWPGNFQDKQLAGSNMQYPPTILSVQQCLFWCKFPSSLCDKGYFPAFCYLDINPTVDYALFFYWKSHQYRISTWYNRLKH